MPNVVDAEGQNEQVSKVFRKLTDDEWAFYSRFNGIISGNPKPLPVQKTLISDDGLKSLNNSSIAAD